MTKGQRTMSDYKLVPVDPTPEMLEAGEYAQYTGCYVSGIYADMLAAAHAVQGEPVGRVKTIGGYPDESEHTVEWLCKHKDLKDGDYLYTAPQLAEQQPEVLAEGYFHPLPDESDYEFHDAEQFPDGSNCPACVPAVIVRKSAVTNQPAPDVAQLVEALEEARLTIEVLQGRGKSAGVTLSIIDRALAPYRKGEES